MTEEGPRSSEAPENLRHEREVEKLKARAAGLLFHREAQEAELRHATPQVGVVPGRAVEERAELLRRPVLLEESPDRILEQFLLFREPEIHREPSRWAAKSRGRPRPRSAITLR